MTDKKPSKTKAIKSQFSAEAIAAGGGILGLITLLLLIYQNFLMSDQTAEMIATNKEMIYQRQMQEKERYHHLIEVLYDTNETKSPYKSSYERKIKEARYNFKLRTEAFHETVQYLKRVKRDLDFSGGFLGYNIDFRGAEYPQLNCSGADLRYSKIVKASLKQSDFSDCDFYEAKLSETDLSDSTITAAIFYYTDLKKANLSNTNLQKTLFRKADMSELNLSKADIRGAVFTEVDLSSVDLSGAIYDDTTLWPQDFDLIASDLKYKMKLVRTKTNEP